MPDKNKTNRGLTASFILVRHNRRERSRLRLISAIRRRDLIILPTRIKVNEKTIFPREIFIPRG